MSGLRKERRFIADAVHADARLDVVLIEYAEHGRAYDLSDSIDLCRRIYTALKAEAHRIGRDDLISTTTPPTLNT